MTETKKGVDMRNISPTHQATITQTTLDIEGFSSKKMSILLTGQWLAKRTKRAFWRCVQPYDSGTCFRCAKSLFKHLQHVEGCCNCRSPFFPDAARDRFLWRFLAVCAIVSAGNVSEERTESNLRSWKQKQESSNLFVVCRISPSRTLERQAA